MEHEKLDSVPEEDHDQVIVKIGQRVCTPNRYNTRGLTTIVDRRVHYTGFGN